jgi:5-methylcytosine-specific restriction endonuclease McrA
VETLVLSAAYEPLARVPWQRAVTLLWIGKVEVVEEYADLVVRAPTLELQMPSVVRFLRALRGRIKKTVRFSRANVYARDGGRCQYCQRALARHEATYDHVVPRAQGGRTTWENVVIACEPCNQKKGGRTPEQAAMPLVRMPTRPRGGWSLNM